MKRLFKIALALALGSLQTLSYGVDFSQEEVLTIDEPLSTSVNLDFAEGEELLPKVGEFKVVSSILMSNPVGERWATVTIENLSPYQRLLDREHLVAIFANGERRYPLEVEYKFAGHEATTLVIYFGESKFPILRVDVRN